MNLGIAGFIQIVLAGISVANGSIAIGSLEGEVSFDRFLRNSQLWRTGLNYQNWQHDHTQDNSALPGM